ncbi:kinesin-domain-containing protein [Xylona heveae TC161]|uniref:Kinesin-like protein n=1 Tax=Xylona heveae (strain CBS 132557 / TC161) TaxID=1328760 RepID=A0A165K143_XYLHT|nr:kinesin-domain-containing protein [Xylona heveae TC161]KZF26874.1 kinesin-domain-containing protein [Xylona heveae TC161]
MATTLPRPSRAPLSDPPASLPPLPSSRPLPGSPKTPSSNRTVSSSRLPTSQAPGKAPSTPVPPLPTGQLTEPRSALPTPLSNAPLKSPIGRTPTTVRKVVSISSFPQPPKGNGRFMSHSSSPLAGAQTETRRGSADTDCSVNRETRSKGGKMKTHNGGVALRTSSLPGKGGEPRTGPNGRGSDALLSIPSPPHSRSSSAQGSDSTGATTLDESGDAGNKIVSATQDAKLKREPSNKDGKGNVIVSVRIRPDLGTAEGGKSNEWLFDGQKSLLAYRGREGGDYYYDNVFTPDDGNDRVYASSVKRIVRRVMEGYHGTVFAYGMTGTGKTFTMQGTDPQPGVIPLAIRDIFSYIRETPRREFLLRVSYLEIYNEKIHDLLAASSTNGAAVGINSQEEIKLREDSKRGVYATPLKEEIVQSPTQLLRVIGRGDMARRTGSTQFNARSSRSHAVVQIVIESRDRTGGNSSVQGGKRSAMNPGGVRVSTLSLIDLAGSERAAESKERRTEGAHINKSLLTLGTIISRLSKDKDKSGNTTNAEDRHLPFRDSKLTRLLQPALSGNSLVSILCTVHLSLAASPAGNATETLNTLKFAARAKNSIVSHAKKAEESYGAGSGDAGSRVLLERYRMEIQDLRSQLENQAKAAKDVEDQNERIKEEKEAEQRHEEQILEIQLARTALKERIEHLTRLILSSKSTGVNSSRSFSSLSTRVRNTAASSDTIVAKPLRSSTSHSTLGVPRPASVRTSSAESADPGSPTSNLENSPTTPGEMGSDEEDSVGEYGNGRASVGSQVRALQADLADRNQYILTLERRLLHARRSSHSRTSLQLSPPHRMSEATPEDNVRRLLDEKDAEIFDLRARLDDKERMIAALRTAARKREVAEMTSKRNHRGSVHSRKSSFGSSTTNTNPVSPTTPSSFLASDKRLKPVDEVTRILDEMLQDRVGPGTQGRRGTVRFSDDIKPEVVVDDVNGLEIVKGEAHAM